MNQLCKNVWWRLLILGGQAKQLIRQSSRYGTLLQMIYFPRGDPNYYRKINGRNRCQIRRRHLGPKHIMEWLNRKCSLQQNHIVRLLIRTRFLTFGFVVSVTTVFVGSITVEKYLLFLAVARAALFMVCIIFISMTEYGGCKFEVDNWCFASQ